MLEESCANVEVVTVEGSAKVVFVVVLLFVVPRATGEVVAVPNTPAILPSLMAASVVPVNTSP